MFRSAVMSVSGSPSTTMMSASFPGAIVPRLVCLRSCAGQNVAARMASIGGMPRSTIVLSSRQVESKWKLSGMPESVPTMMVTPESRSCLNLFGQLRDSGVTIIVGTDSGIPLNFHFDSTWRELKTMVDLGMPPMDAIRAATYWPAQLLKQPNLGTVGPGKLADIIVVDGDPLTDMTALRHIVHVVKNGKVYK